MEKKFQNECVHLFSQALPKLTPIQSDKKKETQQKSLITQPKLMLQGWNFQQLKKQHSNVNLVQGG